MYRKREAVFEVFLVHPGGPYWARKDLGAWSIPKGEYGEDEDPLQAAIREFQEETGFAVAGEFWELGILKQAGGKLVAAWAFEGDCDPNALKSNTFQLEWPPHSGRQLEFPEVDGGSWFAVDEARERILKSQEPFLDRLLRHLQSAE